MQILLQQYQRFYHRWLSENRGRSISSYFELAGEIAGKVLHLIFTQFYLRKAVKGKGVICRKKPSLFIKGKLQLDNGVRIWSTITRTRISVFKNAVITIGEGSIINGSRISAKKNITIGKHCSIAPEVLIMDSDFHEVGNFNQESSAKPVTIGDHVWVANKAVILKGVTIGDHAVVAAGAIVTKDVPPYSVVAGNPARVIKEVKH